MGIALSSRGKIVATRNLRVVGHQGNGIVAVAPIGIILFKDEKEGSTSYPNNQGQESRGLENILGGSIDIIQFTKGCDKIFEL